MQYQVLCCRVCNEEIATQDDIFSMSQVRVHLDWHIYAAYAVCICGHI